jgi:Polyketide cyclase / dehydrase and lipid transport
VSRTREPVPRTQGPFSTIIEQVVDIAADRATVWRALIDPAAVMIWDTGIVRAIDAPADYPLPGQVVRWRYRLAGLPLTLIDQPQEVVPFERLRTHIALAFLRIDETYFLESMTGDAPRTRLAARLAIGNTLPVLSGAFDRWIGRSLASQTVTASLRGVREYCERATPAA